MEGSVYALESDHARTSDAPSWVHLIRWLAIAPAVAVLLAFAIAASILTSMLRRAGPGSRATSPLTYGLGGFILGDLLARRRHVLVQVWRLDTLDGARVVRIAIPPSHPSDVRVGDALRCWVRAHRDGTFSVDRADNLVTGERITPLQPSPLLVFAAVAWTGLLLVALLPALVAHA